MRESKNHLCSETSKQKSFSLTRFLSKDLEHKKIGKKFNNSNVACGHVSDSDSCIAVDDE